MLDGCNLRIFVNHDCVWEYMPKGARGRRIITGVDLGTALGIPGRAQPVPAHGAVGDLPLPGGLSNSANIREPVTCIIYAVFISNFRYLPYVQSQEIKKQVFGQFLV